MEDYYQVAPRYGTNQDLVDLFEEAHKRNMHVLLDLVPGHTSITHAWFKESAQPKKNAYTDRYIWTNSVKKMMDDANDFAQTSWGTNMKQKANFARPAYSFQNIKRFL